MALNYLRVTILLAFAICFTGLVKGQDVELKSFIGAWAYQYSEDSLPDLGWSSFVHEDLMMVDKMNELPDLNQQDPDAVGEEACVGCETDMFGGTDAMDGGFDNLPILLKDGRLQIVFQYPFNDRSGEVLSLALREYKNPNDRWSFTDHTRGFSRIRIVLRDDVPLLVVFNDNKEEEYEILSFSDYEFVLLDRANNVRHYFKSK